MTVFTGRIPELSPKWRTASFGVFSACVLLLFYAPLIELVQFSLVDRYQTYLPFVPLVSLFLLRSQRASPIVEGAGTSPRWALLLVSGLMARFLVPELVAGLSEQSRLSVTILALVVFYIASFVSFYGSRVARRAAFPLAFLIYMVPLPEPVIGTLIAWLQDGTTFVCDLMFWALPVPVVRDGYVFFLRKDFSIEIAPACSGIRSFLVLMIVTTFVSQVTLQRSRSRALLIAAAIPICIFKNALRIVVLAIGSAYFDERFMTTSLHSRGGYPFFVIALICVGLVLIVLRRFETRRERQLDSP